MNPKVSVILTTHGEGKYLNQAIASVLAQTFTDFELLIADDWRGIDSGYRFDHDERINHLQWYVPEKTVNRFAHTINETFKFSHGEFITYLCHDDLYLPYRLDVMVRVMEELKLDIVFGDQQLLNDENGFWGNIRRGNGLMPAGTVDHSSLMHRSECFEKAGGWDESSPMRYGDAFFWKRLIDAGYTFNGIDQVLDVHRFNTDSVTWKIDHKEEDNKKLKEVFKSEEEQSKVKSFVAVNGKPQDTDPHAPHYFAPYDDMGNKRTINNAVDAGWSAVEK